MPKNKDYEIVAVNEYKKAKKAYTHEVKIKKTKGNIKNQTLVVVELCRPNIPDWVKDSDDPKGTDYMNGHIASVPRTFGLNSYLSGVHDAFGDSPITIFEILIK